ncbi:unnamed protein product, partial [Amoebophrya sp. A120]
SLPSDHPRVFGSFLFDLLLRVSDCAYDDADRGRRQRNSAPPGRDPRRIPLAHDFRPPLGPEDLPLPAGSDYLEVDENKDFFEIGPTLRPLESTTDWYTNAAHSCRLASVPPLLDKGSPYTEIIAHLASYTTLDAVWKPLGPERFRIEAERLRASVARNTTLADGHQMPGAGASYPDDVRPVTFHGVPPSHLHEDGTFLYQRSRNVSAHGRLWFRG